MSKKKTIVTLLTTVILGLTILGPSVYAQTNSNSNKGNFFTSFIEFIAQKFGLDKTQVQTAVNQYKQEKKVNAQQNMQDRNKARFDQLVKDGKITQDQENAILAELSALRSKYNPSNMKNLTADQRKQQMQAEQDELKAWAQTNKIDYALIMPAKGPNGINGGRKGMMRGNWNKPSPTESQ